MLILFLPLPNAAAQNSLSAERDGKSLTEQEQDLTFGGGLAVLHRADIQVVWEANLAHRGHVCHRSGTDTSCPWWLFWGPSASESLPLPHLKVASLYLSPGGSQGETKPPQVEEELRPAWQEFKLNCAWHQECCKGSSKVHRVTGTRFSCSNSTLSCLEGWAASCWDEIPSEPGRGIFQGAQHS